MGTVAIYTRISKDREGRAEGVAVQEQRARRYAEEHWPGQTVRVWCDNDITAADPGTFRPAYHDMLGAIRRGEVTQIVCAAQSRLTRQPSEWEELVITLSRAGIDTVHCYRGTNVTVTGSKLIGRILAAVDAEEVEVARARVNDKLSSLAEQGRPPGGTAYGYRSDRDETGRKIRVQIPAQAAAVQHAAAQVLAGASLASIAQDFTARAVPTRRGGRWHPTTVRSILTNPTVAGLRVHQGEIVGTGTWKPILDEITWRRVRAALTGTRTVTRTDGTTYEVTGRRQPARRYLLTGGIATCALCGNALVAQQRRDRRGGRQPSYLCHPTNGGCSRIGIAADPLEDHVTNEVLDWLTAGNYKPPADDTRRTELVAQLADIDHRRSQVAKLYGAGELTDSEWNAARSELTRASEVAAAELAGLPDTTSIDPSTVRFAWPHGTLAEHRQIITAVVDQVVVHPARPGTRTFDPDRVSITWR